MMFNLHYYYHWLQAKTGWFFPKITTLTVEISDLCNLRCPLCPVPSINRPKGIMSLQTYRIILSNLPSTIRLIRMNYAGEPLLNPEAFKIVAESKRRRPDIKIHLVTNGTQLNKFPPQEIFDSGLDNLSVAIDGATREVHQSYRINSDFAEIIAAVGKLTAYKRQYGYRYPRLIQQSLLHRQSVSQIDDLIGLARQLGFDEIHLRYISIPTLTSDAELLRRLFRHYQKREEGELNRLGEYFLPPAEYSQYESTPTGFRIHGERTFCLAFYAPVIFWNGDVTICCFDPEGEQVYGNLLREDFAAVIQKMPAGKIFYRAFDSCRSCTISSQGVNYREIKLNDDKH